MSVVQGAATIGGVRYQCAAEVTLPPPAALSKAAGGLVSSTVSSVANVRQHGPDWLFLKTPWSGVEPSRGQYDWSHVDATLAALAPGGRITLRIQAGGTTPQYLKDLTGSVACRNAARNITVTTAHWWTDTVLDAWRAMILAAGERYDSDPRVVLVSADPVMVVYSEPFILGGDTDTGKRLHALGLTQAVQIAAIRRSVADTVAAFPGTLVELAVHGDLQFPTAAGVGYSWPAGRQLILDLHALHGGHVAFTDYGLGVGDTLATHTPASGETIQSTADVYALLHLLALAGFPTGYQLTPRGETTADNYRQMGQNAVDLGAWWCETSGWGSMTAANITAIDAALKANQN